MKPIESAARARWLLAALLLLGLLSSGTCDQPAPSDEEKPQGCTLPATARWPEWSIDLSADQYSRIRTYSNNIAPSFYDAHKQLFWRDNTEVPPAPSQQGTNAELVTPTNIAVLTGSVFDASEEPDSKKAPLPCVQVTVAGRPEWGRTVTDSVGRFALAIAGEATYTLEFRRPGYLPAQRHVIAQPLNYAVVPRVALVRMPSESQPVDFTKLASSSEMAEVVGASHTSRDASGQEVTRRARLWFEPGTQAQLILPSGFQEAPVLNFLAVEYTAGPHGSAAMPAPLPPTTAFTYAVEYTAKEALQQGASTISFEGHPVVSYVEDFIGFDVGSVVPVGTYDLATARWIPEQNGRVIKVLGARNGEALVATEFGLGDLATDRSTLLGSRLRFTSAELRKLATFPPGTKLWRVLFSHLCIKDKNFPAGPPADASEPPRVDPIVGRQRDDGQCLDKDGKVLAAPPPPFGDATAESLTLDCPRRDYNLKLPIPLSASGTDVLWAHYLARYVPGSRRDLTLSVKVTDAKVHELLKKITVDMDFLGVPYSWEVPRQPQGNGKFYPPFLDFLPHQHPADGSWNQMAKLRSVFGLIWNSGWETRVSVSYYYDGKYYSTADDTRAAFGNVSGTLNPNASSREEIVLTRTSNQISLQGHASPLKPLLGFGINVHHIYSRDRGMLLRGDGSSAQIHGIAPFGALRVAGTSSAMAGACPGKAVDCRLSSPSGLVLNESGTKLYIADTRSFRVLGLSGTNVTTEVGSGSEPLQFGSGRLLEVGLGRVGAMTANGSGNLFIASPVLDDKGAVITFARMAAVLDKQRAYSFAGNASKKGDPSEVLNTSPINIPLHAVGGMAVGDSPRKKLGQILYLAETAGNQIRVIEFVDAEPANKPDPKDWIASSWVLQVPPALATISEPMGLALQKEPNADGSQSLYVANSGRHEILKLSVKYSAADNNSAPVVSEVTRVAGSPLTEGPIPERGKEVAARNVRLLTPTALALWTGASRKFLYVADKAQVVVLRIDLEKYTARQIIGDAGRWTTDTPPRLIPPMSGFGCGLVAGELASGVWINNPDGLAVDPVRGDLYIADSGNNAICKLVTLPSFGTTAADAANFDVLEDPYPDGRRRFHVFAAPNNQLPRMEAAVPAGRHLRTYIQDQGRPEVDEFRFLYDDSREGRGQLSEIQKAGGPTLVVDLLGKRDFCKGSPCMRASGAPIVWLNSVLVANSSAPGDTQNAYLGKLSYTKDGILHAWDMNYEANSGGLVKELQYSRNGTMNRRHFFFHDPLIGEPTSILPSEGALIQFK